jgi:hypothetical protein
MGTNNDTIKIFWVCLTHTHTYTYTSLGSVFGIDTCLRAGRSKNHSLIPGMHKKEYRPSKTPFLRVQEIVFPVMRCVWFEATPSPPSSARIKNELNTPFLPRTTACLAQEIFYMYCAFMYNNLRGPWSRVLTGSHLAKKFPHFIKPEVTLPHLQVPATCPYPEPARLSTHPHISLLKNSF